MLLTAILVGVTLMACSIATGCIFAPPAGRSSTEVREDEIACSRLASAEQQARPPRRLPDGTHVVPLPEVPWDAYERCMTRRGYVLCRPVS